STNLLVSCSTKVKYCEPPPTQTQDHDLEAGTFCITYAGNCTEPNSIQKVWREEEVYPPAPRQDEYNNQNNYDDQSNSNYDPYYNDNGQQYPEERLQPQVPTAPEYDPAPGEDFYNGHEEGAY